MTEKQPQSWPRLSQTLTGPKHPNECQSCGAAPDDHVLLTRWLECEDSDREEAIVVVLCRQCSDRLIEPHPRLYRQLAPHEPMVGVLQLCVGCVHRDGVRCTNPAAQINGGPGLEVVFPKPTRIHVYFGGGRGGWKHLYHGHATECSGRELPAEVRP